MVGSLSAHQEKPTMGTGREIIIRIAETRGLPGVFSPWVSPRVRRGPQREDSWHTDPRGQKLQEESSSRLCNSLSRCFPGQDRTGRKPLPQRERSCGGWRIPSALHLPWMIQTGVPLAGCRERLLWLRPQVHSDQKARKHIS